MTSPGPWLPFCKTFSIFITGLAGHWGVHSFNECRECLGVSGSASVGSEGNRLQKRKMSRKGEYRAWSSPCYCPVHASEASENSYINDGLGLTCSSREAGRLGVSRKLGERSQGVLYSASSSGVRDGKTERDEGSAKASTPFFLSLTSASNQPIRKQCGVSDRQPLSLGKPLIYCTLMLQSPTYLHPFLSVRSPVSQAGHQVAIYPKTILNFLSLHPHLLTAGIVRQHARFMES